jgi:hypothetical protein
VKDPAGDGLPPGGGAKLFVAAIFALGAIGIAAYGLATHGDAVSHSAEVAVLIACAFFAVFFASCAYLLWRLVYPPGARHLKITLATDEPRRGSDIEVTLEVGRQRKPDGRLELGLVCTEYFDVEKTNTNGTTYRGTSEAVAHEDWRPQTGGGKLTERFPVPPDAPFSHRGDCLSYVWRVSAREPRRHRFDRAVNVPVTVRP